MDQAHHVIDYVEINVSDLAVARAFYASPRSSLPGGG
jgi:hypothetical protein